MKGEEMNLQKHWRFGLLLLPAMVLAIVVATAATAKDKPTTTTSTTTTLPPAPKLGVPHVVALNHFNAPPFINPEVRCPAGEVALGQTAVSDKSISTEFIVENDRPVGVRFLLSSDSNNRMAVTCAPVVT
jgi:hypothetical protein